MKHVVWDWNGTLVDDTDHCIAVVNGMLDDAGLPRVDRRRYSRVFDFPVRAYYERLGFDLGGGRFEELAARFIADYDRGAAALRLHERALPVLSALAARGIESSILTAARRAAVEKELEDRRAREHFRDVVGLDDHLAGGKKEIGVEWLRSQGHDPEAMLLVGDTVHDFEVATAMGVRCVLVAAGHHRRERLEPCGCPVVDHLAELEGG